MGVRLLTFMGTSELDSVRYRLDDLVSTESTPFLAEALVQLLRQSEQPVTSVVFLGTAEALAKLRSRWLVQLKHIEDAVGGAVHREVIPSGDDAAGRWEIFRTVARYLKPEPIPGVENEACNDIIFDITHGYRAQSFLGGIAVSWFLAEAARQATWDVHEGGEAAREALAQSLPRVRVLYGAHEPGEGEDDPKYVAPVWDLSEYTTAANWTHALQALRFGRGDYAAVLGRLQSRRAIAAARREGIDGAALQPFNFAADLGRALATFADDMALVRIVDILKGRTGERGGSAARVLDLLESAACREFVDHLPVVEQALTDLRRELQVLDLCAAPTRPTGAAARIASPSGVRAMIDLACLYNRLQRFAEAAIVLRETLVTLFGLTNTQVALIDPCEKGCREQREGLEKALGAVMDGAERPAPADMPMGFGPSAPVASVPEALRKHARAVRAIRNDIQHGSFNDSPAWASTLRDALWERVRELAELLVTPKPPDEDKDK